MQRLIRGAVGLLFPSDVRCVLCGKEEGIRPHSGLCEDCLTGLPHDCRGETILGVPCYWALLYEGDARKMITDFKFENKRYLGRTLGYLMAEAFAAQLAGESFDAICPMPLHRNRLRRRGYNQSLILSEELGESTGVPVLRDVLIRSRDTAAQMDLNREERMENVKGAFACERDLSGMRVLIVDDILTTGASIGACADAVREAGGTAVGFCAARRELQGRK